MYSPKGPIIPEWRTDVVPLVDHPAANSTGRKGISFGLPSLSKALEGMEKGELVAITAPPSGGKSTLSRTFALDFIKQGLNVIYCTYELTLAQTKTMFDLAGLSEIENQKLLLTPLEHTQKDILFIEKLVEANKDNYVDCIIIDDFHALEEQYSNEKERSLPILLRALASRLKNIAITYNCIVITMAHLRKDAIRLKDNSLGDIAYSGGLAQVADTVFAIRNIGNNQASIEVTKSRWTGTQVKVKCMVVNKRFQELTFYDQAPADLVNQFRNQPQE